MTAGGAPGARPDVLICAGLDPSGGAGLIADVRVVSELGGRSVGVVTALTVQSTAAVLASEPVSAELVRAQLELLLSDIEIRAVKIGLIGASAVAESIGVALALTQAPVVWDPVMHPSRGELTFVDNLFGHAVIALAPHLTLLTPNAAELMVLAGKPIRSVADARAAGQALAAKLQCAVLAKGGHLGGADGDGSEESREAIDVLCFADRAEELRLPRVPGGEHVHGTGCALSSAIATHLAHGVALVDACRAAKAYVAAKIAAPARPGRGAGTML